MAREDRDCPVEGLTGQAISDVTINLQIQPLAAQQTKSSIRARFAIAIPLYILNNNHTRAAFSHSAPRLAR